jgi:oleate hydratase
MSINKHRKAYLVGGGIASLASAVYLIDDGGFEPENISIFEAKKAVGGSLDARKKHTSKAYIMTGHRILAKNAYECTYDLMARVPSAYEEGLTLKEEIDNFNKQFRTHNKARLVEHGRVVDAHSLGLRHSDRWKLVRLFWKGEQALQGLRINEYFDQSFFWTNFWLEFSTVFAFQPWHSLAEFRRYIYRSFHALPYYDTMDCIRIMPYNQHDSLVKPIQRWLEERGVNFITETMVTDAHIESADRKRLRRLCYSREGENDQIELGEDDLAFLTLGSMTSSACFGSMTKAPKRFGKRNSPAWNFWENIADKHSFLGRPAVFDEHAKESRWESFTITFRDGLFFDLMEKLTGNRIGTGGGTSLRKSNWLLSLTTPPQPHFVGQPEHVRVMWGYALRPGNRGNFISKEMQACSGEEILVELIGHLGFNEHKHEIIKSATCVPCLMPYITSQFAPRRPGDRPAVVPEGAENFALLGQFCEIPHDIVFTVEYSVRSAQIAVYTLLGLDKPVQPIYRGHLYPRNVYRALKTMFR